MAPIGWGAGADMQKSSGQNRQLQGKRKSYKDITSDGFSEKGNSSLKFKEASQEELDAYRVKIAERIAKERLRNRILLIAVVTLVTAIFFWILL